jgi:Glycoside hydrolase family 5 C-terminal domain/Cellulase (glycosyl hydrolase family 5)
MARKTPNEFLFTIKTQQEMTHMIRTNGDQFKDEHGRTLMLRGVNLGGSSKVPFQPNGSTYIREGFFDHRQVSFVGRPFPLEEVDEHFKRLREWGFTFLRFLVTWEAIEHAGPGIYDQAYLDYVYAVVKKAGEHGIQLFIDPHQDVWSRFSGGDGAPGWTLEAVGFDLTQFAETGAAIVHATQGDPFPRMIWPTNATKLASATMFTLFFGGDDFAPSTRVEGESAQQYLQQHYIAAIQQLALRLRDLPNVVGYDTLNEPSTGYIGWRDLRVAEGLLKIGDTPTPFQSMLLGAGISQSVERYALTTWGMKRIGTRELNAQRVRVWREGFDCVWRQNGVWDFDNHGAPQLLRPDYFAQVGGREVDFARDYYRPFVNRFARAIHEVDPDALIFIEAEPTQLPPRWTPSDARSIVWAPHWYDAMVLLTKRFNPFIAVDSRTAKLVFGPGAIRRSFAAQLAHLKRGAAEQFGGVPTLIGECGIPFDLQEKRAYRTGDYSAQIKAMDRTFRAVEDNLLNATLWNYTADNTNARGDQWNDEDLSIFSRDQQTHPADINSGGRALQAIVRPYARATAGMPLRISFDWKRRGFEFTFQHDPRITAPTELFVPHLQYPRGYTVRVSDGTFEAKPSEQTLLYHHSQAREIHTIHIQSR